MIAVHLLAPEAVDRAMRDHHCEFVKDADAQHQIWRTAWGFHFTLPVIGDDRWCPKIVLFEILADVERTRPNH